MMSHKRCLQGRKRSPISSTRAGRRANDKDGRFSTEAIEALSEAGLLGLTLPAELGGSALGPRTRHGRYCQRRCVGGDDFPDAQPRRSLRSPPRSPANSSRMSSSRSLPGGTCPRWPLVRRVPAAIFGRRCRGRGETGTACI